MLHLHWRTDYIKFQETQVNTDTDSKGAAVDARVLKAINCFKCLYSYFWGALHLQRWSRYQNTNDTGEIFEEKPTNVLIIKYVVYRPQRVYSIKEYN